MGKNGNVIELDCSANCHFILHLSCSHESLKAVSKKYLTDQESCLTPDCWGQMTSLVFKHQNGKVYKTLKVDALQKSVKKEMKNEKQNSSSSTPKSSPRKNLPVNLKKNFQPFIAQDADVRHLQKDAKVFNRILVNEEDSRNIKKLKKRSVRNIKKRPNTEIVEKYARWRI